MLTDLCGRGGGGALWFTHTGLPVGREKNMAIAVNAVGSIGGEKGNVTTSAQPKLLDRMIYTHVLNRGPVGVRSPVDGL